MKLFIVTPSFNSEETIEQTLASVFNQLHPNCIYYHVQDGGSKDRTITILESWRDRFASRGIHFSFSSEPDNGIYDGILKGFSTFKATDDDWMAWINSDDQLSGLFSYTLFKLQNSISWVTGKPAIISKAGKMEVLERYYSTEIVKSGLCDGLNWYFVQQEGTAWRYKAWIEADCFSVLNRYKYAGDFHLWVRLASHFKLFQCSYPMGMFNLRDGQASQKFRERYFQETMDAEQEINSLCKSHAVNLISLNGKFMKFENLLIKISSKKEFKMEYLCD
jgi:glycosyltransferase involved in cell wall biosynthesis